MNTRTRTIRRCVALPLLAVMAAGLAGCGDDDDGAADTPTEAADTVADTADTTADATAETEAPAETTADTDAPVETTAGNETPEEPTADTEAPHDTAHEEHDDTVPDGSIVPTATTEFCDSFVGLELAFQSAPSDDAEAIGPYVEAEIVPRLASLRANLPTEVEAEVTVMADAVDAVASGSDFSAFDTPEFAAASEKIYPYLGDACDMPVYDVVAMDYSFGGVPPEVEAGPTVFVLHNESPSGEAHEMGFARVKDGVDLPLEELLALPMEELEANVEISGGTFAMAGGQGGAIISLTEGRWVYVCLIPVGSIDGQEGDGPPHIVEGMSGELTVT